jgi:hypothetical protein
MSQVSNAVYAPRNSTTHPAKRAGSLAARSTQVDYRYKKERCRAQTTMTGEPTLAVPEGPTIEQWPVWWEAMPSDDLTVGDEKTKGRRCPLRHPGA